jgi:hypothetical protein
MSPDLHGPHASLGQSPSTLHASASFGDRGAFVGGGAWGVGSDDATGSALGAALGGTLAGSVLAGSVLLGAGSTGGLS